MNLRLDTSQGLRRVIRSGVLATLGCSQRCTVRVDLRVSSAARRAFKLPSQLVGRRTVVVRSGLKTFRVRLTPAAERRLRRAHSVRISVRATWSTVRPTIRKSGTVRVRRP
jgi:hypothetical protein